MRTDLTHGSEFHHAMDHYMASLVQRRDFAGAVKYYEDTRRELEATGGAVTGSILRHAATAYASLSNYPAALKTARIAQHEASQEGDNVALAEVFVTLGGILRDMGEWKEAEKAYRDAESLFRRYDDIAGQSRALNLLAGLFYRRGDYKNSLSVLLDATAIARQSHDRKMLAYMMGNIGRIYTFIGDFSEAQKHLQTNIDLSTQLSDWLEVARAQLALGYLHIQQAAYDSAEQALDHGSRLLSSTNSPRDEVIHLTYLGELQYRHGRLKEALQTLEAALKRAEEMSPTSTLTARVRRHLAELHIRLKNYTSAHRFAARAMLTMKKANIKVEVGALWKIKAIISEANTRNTNGREYFEKALDILKEAGAWFERADALVAAGSSKLFCARQRLTYLFRAEEFYRRNRVKAKLQEVERIINSVHYPVGKTGKTDTSSSTHDRDIEYLTNCSEIKRFKAQLLIIGRSDLPLLLSGETGVGKDHLARYFHHLVRPGAPLVIVNCASIPETLLESELFGYQKGAFTGAEGDKKGLFVAANRGVLYLDEIGDMPLSLQAKLLGFLETKRVIPLGTTDEIRLDIKLVAATNKDLEKMIAQGSFRHDLYFRLSGITFQIPALRDRKEDIPLLLHHFMRKCNLLETDGKIPPELAHQFVEYDWPGNVRELSNKVKRLEVMVQLVSEGDLVELAHSLFSVEMSQDIMSFFDRIEQYERKLLVEALLAADGNKSEAARILGIHEATVRTKLKRYSISVEGGAAH